MAELFDSNSHPTVQNTRNRVASNAYTDPAPEWAWSSIWTREIQTCFVHADSRRLSVTSPLLRIIRANLIIYFHLFYCCHNSTVNRAMWSAGKAGNTKMPPALENFPVICRKRTARWILKELGTQKNSLPEQHLLEGTGDLEQRWQQDFSMRRS